jgi:hypothetical protein
MDKLIQFRGGTKVHNDKKTVDLFRALDPTTSPNALIELSDSNDPRTLRAVAKHKNTPSPTLGKLLICGNSYDNDLIVKYNALDNPHTSEQDIIYVSNFDKDPGVRKHAKEILIKRSIEESDRKVNERRRLLRVVVDNTKGSGDKHQS